MILKAFMILLLASHAIGELCVNYNFEEGFTELFSDYGVCNTLPLWSVGKYEDIKMIGDQGSTTFITPSSEFLSCASSFTFPMKSGGVIELDVYIERPDVKDQIEVFVNQILADGSSFVRAKSSNVVGSGDSGYIANGWQTLKISLTGDDAYEGFISILGKASPDSIMLIDAIRYTPPNVDDSFCEDPKNIFIPSKVSFRKTTTRRTTTTKRTTTTPRTTQTTKRTTTTSTTPRTTTTTRRTTSTTRSTPQETTTPYYETM